MHIFAVSFEPCSHPSGPVAALKPLQRGCQHREFLRRDACRDRAAAPDASRPQPAARISSPASVKAMRRARASCSSADTRSSARRESGLRFLVTVVRSIPSASASSPMVGEPRYLSAMRTENCQLLIPSGRNASSKRRPMSRLPAGCAGTGRYWRSGRWWHRREVQRLTCEQIGAYEPKCQAPLPPDTARHTRPRAVAPDGISGYARICRDFDPCSHPSAPVAELKPLQRGCQHRKVPRRGCVP